MEGKVHEIEKSACKRIKESEKQIAAKAAKIAAQKIKKAEGCMQDRAEEMLREAE